MNFYHTSLFTLVCLRSNIPTCLINVKYLQISVNLITPAKHTSYTYAHKLHMHIILYIHMLRRVHSEVGHTSEDFGSYED